MNTIPASEVRALAGDVLVHRLSHWPTGPAPKGRVAVCPLPPVPCELAWDTVRAALCAGTLEVSP